MREDLVTIYISYLLPRCEKSNYSMPELGQVLCWGLFINYKELLLTASLTIQISPAFRSQLKPQANPDVLFLSWGWDSIFGFAPNFRKISIHSWHASWKAQCTLLRVCGALGMLSSFNRVLSSFMTSYFVPDTGPFSHCIHQSTNGSPWALV